MELFSPDINANLLSPLKTGPKTDLIVFIPSYGENKTCVCLK